MEYYRRPHQRAPSDGIGIASCSSSRQDEAPSRPAGENSIYIFPSPPSAPPSPSLIAPPSLVLLDRVSSVGTTTLRSRSASLVTETADLEWEPDDVRSPVGSAVSGGEDIGVGPWEWPASAEGTIEENEVDLNESIMRLSKWDPRVSRRALHPQHTLPSLPLAIRAQRSAAREPSPRDLSWIRARTESATSSLSSVINIPVPHPRIRLPLLSFFASLLRIDDSTLHLISYTPEESVLFPGHRVELFDERADESLLHGSAALLLEQKEGTVLKEGMHTACDSSLNHPNSFALTPIPLTGLFWMVKSIWSGSRSALREVLQ
ncbi:hypothetical protein K488DRAFT_82082 [Vararia minispora EC-137]|uniref:Uncharacterized protein n=1 Tax=Vararia minispora EC-137 TaxID=1314806 RepID=A0ACB8QXA4_9AGAM|nr:hypothetical protein K488DRAFT_82082 [Vararia minispora EC-137]